METALLLTALRAIQVPRRALQLHVPVVTHASTVWERLALLVLTALAELRVALRRLLVTALLLTALRASAVVQLGLLLRLNVLRVVTAVPVLRLALQRPEETALQIRMVFVFQAVPPSNRPVLLVLTALAELRVALR